MFPLVVRFRVRFLVSFGSGLSGACSRRVRYLRLLYTSLANTLRSRLRVGGFRFGLFVGLVSCSGVVGPGVGFWSHWTPFVCVLPLPHFGWLGIPKPHRFWISGQWFHPTLLGRAEPSSSDVFGCVYRACDMVVLGVCVLTFVMFVPLLPFCSWCRVWCPVVIMLSVQPRENPCVLLLWVSLVPLLSLYRAGGKMRVQFVVILSGR